VNLERKALQSPIVPRAQAQARAVARSIGAGRAAFILGALILPGCAAFAPQFTRPDLSVVAIEMQSGSFLQQNFIVTLEIHNPNDRTLPVDRVDATLTLAGEAVASGVTSRPFVVPADGATRFRMLITANMAAGILALVGRMNAHQQTIDYQLSGTVRLRLPFMRSLPFSESGSLPLRSGGR